MPPWYQTVLLILIFLVGAITLNNAGRGTKAETVGAVMTLSPVLLFIVLVGLQAVRS